MAAPSHCLKQWSFVVSNILRAHLSEVSVNKIHLKLSIVKRWPFDSGLKVIFNPFTSLAGCSRDVSCWLLGDAAGLLFDCLTCPAEIDWQLGMERLWITWWRHSIETLSASLALFERIYRSREPPHKSRWCCILITTSFCWTNIWKNNRLATY